MLSFYVVKHIPLWMPGSGFKSRAFEIRDLVRKMLDTPFEMVKDAMVGLPPFFYPSLMYLVLEIRHSITLSHGYIARRSPQ